MAPCGRARADLVADRDTHTIAVLRDGTSSSLYISCAVADGMYDLELIQSTLTMADRYTRATP